MTDIKWIKISTAIFDDEKIQLIEAMPDADTLLTIWLKLLVLAGKINKAGELYLSEETPYTDEMLATIFHRPLNSVRLALTLFSSKQFKLIGIKDGLITITNWGKYQNIDGMERVRELARERMRKSREHQKLLARPKFIKILPDPVNVPKKIASPPVKNEMPLPDWIDQELWDNFMEVRKKLKAIPTERAIKELIAELIKLKKAGNDPSEVIKQSIMNSWKGVFALKGDRNGTDRKNPRQLVREYTDPTVTS
jgi:predicted phage replisome organizer